MSHWRFRPPPRTLGGANLDNLVIIPANQLPKITTYQAAANRLPRGQVLIVISSKDDRKSQILRKVARLLEAKGQRVTTLAENLA
jgi:hypothetical protein